jgi:hypothetical protein
MKSSLNLLELKQVLEIFKKTANNIKMRSDLFNIKCICIEPQTKTVKFCLSPKIIQESLVDSYENVQKEYNFFLNQALQNFGTIREVFSDYVDGNIMLKHMFDLDLKVEKFKSKRPKIYSESGETHGLIYRNDFMYDSKDKQLYQIEVNLIAASMHSFAQNLSNMVKCLYSDLDSHGTFKSKK